MIVRAIICPGAPFLIPELAPRLADRVPELVEASKTAVRSLGQVDRIVVLSVGHDGAGTVTRPPGTRVPTAPLARSDRQLVPDAVLPGAEGVLSSPRPIRVPAHGTTQPPMGAIGSPAGNIGPAVGTIVAASLIGAAGIAIPVTAVEVDPSATAALPDRAWRLIVSGVKVDRPVRTGLLVIADGAAAHGPSAPGAENPASAEFDEALRTILAAADPAALSAFCANRADEAMSLRCEAIPALRILAELTAERPPNRGRMEFYGNPFGVGYLVADWQWE